MHWQGPGQICPPSVGDVSAWCGAVTAPWFLAAGRPCRRSRGALLSGHVTGHAPGTWCASSDLAQRRSLLWHPRRGGAPVAAPRVFRGLGRRPGPPGGGAANGRCATSGRSASCRWLGPSLSPLMAHVLTGRLRPGAASLAVYTEVARRQEPLLAPRPERPSPWPDDQSGPLAMLPSCWANSDS